LRSRYEEDASKKKMGAPSRYRNDREFTTDSARPGRLIIPFDVSTMARLEERDSNDLITKPIPKAIP
jgi:hypothetical protein